MRHLELDPNIPVEGLVRKLILDTARALLSYKGVEAIIQLPASEDLTLIGLVGWTAWTIADKLRDEQNLPNRSIYLAAFSCLASAMHGMLSALDLNVHDRKAVTAYLRRMESANGEESARLREDSVRYISSWKSMGAALPMVLCMMRISASASDLSALERYFFHFLGARQIADDLCDLEEDLASHKRTLPTIWHKKHLNKEAVDRRGAREIIRECERAIENARLITSFTSTQSLEALPRRYIEMARAELAAREAPIRPNGSSSRTPLAG